MSLLALFPLDVVLFPGAPLPLHIFEPRYKEMIGECLDKKIAFGMVRAQQNALAEVGCTAVITHVDKKYEDGRLDIATQGRQRFEIIQLNDERSFPQAEVVLFEDDPSEVPAANLETVVQLHTELFSVMGQPADVEPQSSTISFLLANQLPVDLDFKQALLEMKSEAQRVETLIEYYRATIPKVEKTLRAREKAGSNGHVH